MTTTLSRETAILQLEDLTARVCQALADEDVEAVDLLMTAPSRPGDEADATQLTVCGGLSRLTQLWVVIGVLHGIATKGKKLTQASHIASRPSLTPTRSPASCRAGGVAARALVPHQADGAVRKPRLF